jgi:chemotaxis protein methyltransferase CheR
MNDPWGSDAFAKIADLVERESGLHFPSGRREPAESGIRRAMERARVRQPEQYLALIRQEQAAMEELIAELTVGETYFFRDEAQFTFIREELAPRYRRRAAAGHRLRVWSAGCASGEEPYSLAIVMREAGLGPQTQVLGTDIARHRLASARQARYSKWSLRGVAPAVAERYFRRQGREYALVPEVREGVEFRYLNLAEDHYPSLASGIWGMDLILCRNVLIYFDHETVARVARRLVDSLTDDGWLVLGASDPPIAELVDCEVVMGEQTIAYRRQGRRGASPRPAWRRATQPPAAAEASVEPAPGAVPPLSPAEDRRALDAFDAMAAGHAAEAPAVEASVKSADADPDAVAAALVAYRAGRYEEAERHAAARLDAGDDDAALWVIRARALANRGLLQDAERVCVAALDRHRTSPELLYLHSMLLGQAARHTEAAAAARAALYLDRSFVVAHLALADASARAGRRPDARRALRNAARLLEGLPPEAEVAGTDGERAGRLAELVRMRLQLLEAE